MPYTVKERGTQPHYLSMQRSSNDEARAESSDFRDWRDCTCTRQAVAACSGVVLCRPAMHGILLAATAMPQVEEAGTPD